VCDLETSRIGAPYIYIYIYIYDISRLRVKFLAHTLHQIFTPSKHFFIADFNPILRTQIVGGFINHINTKFHTSRQLIFNTVTVSFYFP